MHYKVAGNSKKVHPSDTYHALQVSRAASFAVWFRKGPHETFKRPAATLEEAKAIALEMNAEHGRFGRRSVIYAITPEGASFPV